MSPLYELKEGEQGEVVEISRKQTCHRNHGHKGNCNGHSRISELGIRVGKTVKVLQNRKRGALLVKVDESRIAIGRGMAEKILIKKPKKKTK